MLSTALLASAGCLCGAGGSLAFDRLVDQSRERAIKQEMRRLKRASRQDDLDPGQAVRLALAHFGCTLRLFRVSLPAALLVSGPAFAIVLWLDWRGGGWTADHAAFLGSAVAGAVAAKLLRPGR